MALTPIEAGFGGRRQWSVLGNHPCARRRITARDTLQFATRASLLISKRVNAPRPPEFSRWLKVNATVPPSADKMRASFQREDTMIRFNCPTCRKELSVPDSAAGKTGKCLCGERVRVPDVARVGTMAPAPVVGPAHLSTSGPTPVTKAAESRRLSSPRAWVLAGSGPGSLARGCGWTLGDETQP